MSYLLNIAEQQLYGTSQAIGSPAISKSPERHATHPAPPRAVTTPQLSAKASLRLRNRRLMQFPETLLLLEILMAFPSSVPQGTCQVNFRISPETFLKLQQRVHRGKRTAFVEAVLRRELDHQLATKPEAQK